MNFVSREGRTQPFRLMAFSAVCVLFGSLASLNSQTLYDDHEGQAVVTYATHPESRVKMTDNPARDAVNGSSRCAMFSRTRQRYDYIKVIPIERLAEVQAYASHDANAPKLRMKIYTDAPIGSIVEIQLGKQDGNAYPQGTHSQYQAKTTVSGAWEELEFTYSMSPKGSETKAKEVDQITLLFMPGTAATYAFYFDDLQGPPLRDNPQGKVSKK